MKYQLQLPELTPDQRRDLIEQFSHVTNEHKVIIMDGGMKMKPLMTYVTTLCGHKLYAQVDDQTAEDLNDLIQADHDPDFPYMPLSAIPLEGWTVEKMDECLFYWKPHDEQPGFEFDAYEIIQSGDGQETLVEKRIHGIAYFDGVRHLYLGCEENDNDGYDYYPNIDMHIRVLQRVKELEIQLCPER